LTQATGPNDASEAVNSGKPSEPVLSRVTHALTCKHIIVLNVCSKTHYGYRVSVCIQDESERHIDGQRFGALAERRGSGSVIERGVTCFTSELGRIMISVSISKSCKSFLYIKSIIVVSIVPRTSSSFLVAFLAHFCLSFSTNTVGTQRG
jgi:hypothetical protein